MVDQRETAEKGSAVFGNGNWQKTGLIQEEALKHDGLKNAVRTVNEMAQKIGKCFRLED